MLIPFEPLRMHLRSAVRKYRQSRNEILSNNFFGWKFFLYFPPKAGKYINGVVCQSLGPKKLWRLSESKCQIFLDIVSGRDVFRFFWTLSLDEIFSDLSGHGLDLDFWTLNFFYFNLNRTWTWIELELEFNLNLTLTWI